MDKKIKLPQSSNNKNMPLISPMKYYMKLETIENKYRKFRWPIP